MGSIESNFVQAAVVYMLTSLVQLWPLLFDLAALKPLKELGNRHACGWEPHPGVIWGRLKTT